MAFPKAERSHEKYVEGPEYFPVFKSDPFINELLRQIRPQYITLDEFDAIATADKNRQGEESIIRFGTVRKIDVTGFVPNLVGSHTTAEETLVTFDAIAAKQLEIIDRFPEKEREEVFHAMEGKETTLEGVLQMVKRQDDVMRILEKIRERSPLAQCIRQLNTQAVKTLYQQDNLRSIFDDHIINRPGIHGGKLLEVLHTKEPRICYVPWLDGDNVKYVDEYYFTPNLWRVIVTGPIFDRYVAQNPSLKQFEDQSVGHIIDAITPNIFKKEHAGTSPPDPQTLSGWMALVGKGGSLFYRNISDWMTRKEQQHAEAMKDQESAQAIHDYFLNRD